MAVDGELPPNRQALVEEHMSGCLACRSRFDRIRTTIAESRELYEASFGPDATAEPSSRLRLEHALRQAAEDSNGSWLTRLRTAMVMPQMRVNIGMAAAVVLLAVVWMSGAGDALRGPSRNVRTPLPIAALTPGAVSSLTAKELSEGARPSRLVTTESRDRVLRAYGMERVSARTYELDALITPELGGTTEPENLWPQRFASPVWNARVKDELEQLLPRLVCANELDLAQAQREIATDWVAAYQRYFRTPLPLHAHRGAPLADDDELEFAPRPNVHPQPLLLGFRFAPANR
jgi:hypothetical protein